MTEVAPQPLRYPVPEDRLRLDWERVEAIADCSFAEPIRVSIESHLTWYEARRNYYDIDVSPNRYGAALDALNKVLETSGARDRWDPIENQLETVMEFLEVMAEPFEIENRQVHALYILFFQLWTSIGEAGVKLSQRKGEMDGDLSLAQKVLKDMCLQCELYVQSDEAIAKRINRALTVTRRAGTLRVTPLSQ